MHAAEDALEHAGVRHALAAGVAEPLALGHLTDAIAVLVHRQVAALLVAKEDGVLGVAVCPPARPAGCIALLLQALALILQAPSQPDL